MATASTTSSLMAVAGEILVPDAQQLLLAVGMRHELKGKDTAEHRSAMLDLIREERREELEPPGVSPAVILSSRLYLKFLLNIRHDGQLVAELQGRQHRVLVGQAEVGGAGEPLVGVDPGARVAEGVELLLVVTGVAVAEVVVRRVDAGAFTQQRVDDLVLLAVRRQDHRASSPRPVLIVRVEVVPHVRLSRAACQTMGVSERREGVPHSGQIRPPQQQLRHLQVFVGDGQLQCILAHVVHGVDIEVGHLEKHAAHFWYVAVFSGLQETLLHLRRADGGSGEHVGRAAESLASLHHADGNQELSLRAALAGSAGYRGCEPRGCRRDPQAGCCDGAPTACGSSPRWSAEKKRVLLLVAILLIFMVTDLMACGTPFCLQVSHRMFILRSGSCSGSSAAPLRLASPQRLNHQPVRLCRALQLSTGAPPREQDGLQPSLSTSAALKGANHEAFYRTFSRTCAAGVSAQVNREEQSFVAQLEVIVRRIRGDVIVGHQSDVELEPSVLLAQYVSKAVDIIGPGSLEVSDSVGPPLHHRPSASHVVHLTEHLQHRWRCDCRSGDRLRTSAGVAVRLTSKEESVSSGWTM
ncbi:hypothetical protein EYF80_026322 [Liparis tanakae]|uniref:Uncharacterized protein n=1 Tax=Liparis tanakae TaxID=230148 RepID=A0A4Z2HFA3_9TELE|nr:hypothetical protein EYF80_026322 [Liparis tanakae]